MASRIITVQQIETLAATAFGQQLRARIPRDKHIGAIHMRVTGQIDKTAVVTAGTVLAENPFTTLNRIQLRGGGRDNLKDVSAATLAVLNRLNRGGPANINTATTAAAGTNEAFNYRVSLEFMYPHRRFAEPLDTVLDAPFLYRNSQLELICYMEGLNSNRGGFVTGNADHTYALDSFNVALELEQVIVPEGEEQIRIGWTLPIETTDVTHTVTATSTNLRLNMDAGLQYRQVLLKALLETGSSHGTYDPTNGTVNNWRIKAGIEQFFDAEDAHLRDRMVGDYQLSAALTGYYLADFSKEGKVTEALPTEGLTDLHHSLDVTDQSNGDRLEFTTLRYLPIPEKAKLLAKVA